MKLIEAKQFHNALNSLPLDTFPREVRLAIIDNILEVTPLTEKFDKVIKLAQEKYYTDEYKSALEALQHKEQEYQSEKDEKKKAALLSERDALRIKVNEASAPFVKEMDEFLEDKYNENIPVRLKMVDRDTFIEVVAALKKGYSAQFYLSLKSMFIEPKKEK